MASVEIDKHCQKVLAKHFPDSALFDDVAKVSGDDLRAVGFVPERGIITAGFPCQDISIAGKGRGLSGERSGLFWEIVRLLDELHPKWFMLENVPRLLTINGGRDMDTVAEALVECGYGFAYRVLDASNFGVPQRRRRVFIVGHLGDSGRAPAQVLFEPESLSGDLEAGGEEKQETPPATEGSVGTGGPIAFHMTQDPISGPISPCLSANASIGFTHTHTSTLQGGGLKRQLRVGLFFHSYAHVKPR